MPAIEVPARPGDVHQEELVATDEHLPHLDRALACQPLDEDIDQLVFVVLVEHVRQPVRGQAHHSRLDAVFAVRDEFDLLAGPGRVPRWRSRGVGRGVRATEHDAQTASEALDHAPIVGAATTRAQPPTSTRGEMQVTDGAERRGPVPARA